MIFFLFRSAGMLAMLLIAGGCAQGGAVPDSKAGPKTSDQNRQSQETPGETDSKSANATSSAPNADTPAEAEPPGKRFFVTPGGAGAKDGSNWENAAPADKLNAILAETVEPGDVILLGSGKFPQLVFRRSGRPGKPISIQGKDTGDGLPRIAGRWKETNPKYHAHSWNGLTLAKDVSHVRISGLRISRFIYGIKAADNRDVHLAALDVTQCREAIWLSNLVESEIRDCRLVQYTKRGIDFEAGCRKLLIEGVLADATDGDANWPTEAYPFGFAVEKGDGNANRDIRFVRCTARNNLWRGEPGKYWNGDGFVAESDASGLSYAGCFSFDNSDGGWDDKSEAPSLVNCVAGRNKRGFRFWNVRGSADRPARLKNCLGVYNKSRGGSGSAVGLWLCGAVEARRCTFHNNASAAVGIENNGPGGNLVAINCILSADESIACETLVRKEGNTQFEPRSVIQWNAGPADEAPNYLAPARDWNGTPRNAFDSRRYGTEHGYLAAERAD